MVANNNSSFNETLDLLNFESNKLQSLIEHNLKNLKNLSLPEIIEGYYQVINVTSLTELLRKNLEYMKNSEEHTNEFTIIKKIEKYIDDKFNTHLHLLILDQLSKSIDSLKNQLKEIKTKKIKTTKEEIEKHAEIYENLRQIMSTKEFVDQYNVRLKK